MKEGPKVKSGQGGNRKRLLFSMVIIFLLSLFLSGWALGHSAWWKEEVLLHDGRTIIVDRSQKLGGYPTLDSHDRTVLEEKWVFPIQATNKFVTWKINQELPPKGHSLSLLVVGFVHGVPYIATSPAGCISYNYWGRPNPPYVFFKYDSKTWQRIKLEEFPSELTESNVIVGRPDYQNRTGTIPIARIKQDNRYLEPHLKKVMRQPVKSAQTMDCEELIYYKGGWILPNDPVARKFMDFKEQQQRK